MMDPYGPHFLPGTGKTPPKKNYAPVQEVSWRLANHPASTGKAGTGSRFGAAFLQQKQYKSYHHSYLYTYPMCTENV